MRFAQAIGQQEEKHQTYVLLAKETDERLHKVLQQLAGRKFGTADVGVGAGQGEAMVQGNRNEQTRHEVERQAPCQRNVPARCFQPSGQHHQDTLPEDIGQAVERVADAHEERLFARGQSQHVEAVGGNVVRGRAESHQPEAGQRSLYIMVGRDEKGDARHRGSYQRLHGGYPPAFGLDEVHKGAPQRLDGPGQVEPRGVEGNLRVAKSQPLVQDDGQGHHSYVWQPFGKVEGGDP